MTDKYTNRYNVSLNFVNDLLKSLNISPIDNLLNFKIKREVLINVDVVPFMDNLFTYYKKDQLKYYTRNRIKNYVLTVLKVLLSKINHKLTVLRIGEDISGKNVIVTYYIIQQKNIL